MFARGLVSMLTCAWLLVIIFIFERYDASLYFSRSVEYGIITDTSLIRSILNGGGDFSIQTWFSVTSGFGKFSSILSTLTSSTSDSNENNGLVVGISSSDTDDNEDASPWLKINNADFFMPCCSYYNDGNWHHLIVTKNSSSVIFYIDGKLKYINKTFNNSSNNSDYSNLNESIWIGFDSSGDSSMQYKGYIDELAIWKRVLNWYEILQLYYYKLSSIHSLYCNSQNYNDLIVYYPMDQLSTQNNNNNDNQYIEDVINSKNIYFGGSSSTNTFDPSFSYSSPVMDICSVNQCPTQHPTNNPTYNPSKNPTPFPSPFPTVLPTADPSFSPTNKPSDTPTTTPTDNPTPIPTNKPSANPSRNPSFSPTPKPTIKPTQTPTNSPTPNPTPKPTPKPSPRPTPKPTSTPTNDPTPHPTPRPTLRPTPRPTPKPTPNPTSRPTWPILQPVPTSPSQPTSPPVCGGGNPNACPRMSNANRPSDCPIDKFTDKPSLAPSHQPTENPISTSKTISNNSVTDQFNTQDSNSDSFVITIGGKNIDLSDNTFIIGALIVVCAILFCCLACMTFCCLCCKRRKSKARDNNGDTMHEIVSTGHKTGSIALPQNNDAKYGDLVVDSTGARVPDVSQHAQAQRGKIIGDIVGKTDNMSKRINWNTSGNAEGVAEHDRDEPSLEIILKVVEAQATDTATVPNVASVVAAAEIITQSGSNARPQATDISTYDVNDSYRELNNMQGVFAENLQMNTAGNSCGVTVEGEADEVVARDILDIPYNGANSTMKERDQHNSANGANNQIDELNYQDWSQKESLLWFKDVLLDNHFEDQVISTFLKELSTKCVTGKTLAQFKKNGKHLETFQSQFSSKNQAFAIWLAIQTAIDDIGK